MSERIRVATLRISGAVSPGLATALDPERWERVASFDDIAALHELSATRAQVLLVETETADVELIRELGRVPEQLPTAIFTEQGDERSARAAVEAGICAYVIGSRDAIQTGEILALAQVRFEYLARLRGELEQTRAALSDRKVIERAKGFLMRQYSFAEDQAYRLLQKRSMDTGQRMVNIAQSILDRARPTR